MQLQTTIKLPPSPSSPLTYGDGVLSLGSCFSQHIGLYLASRGHSVVTNPFGIQYNPLSIHRNLSRLIEATPYEESELIWHDGLYHSPDHHGAYSYAEAERCLEAINLDLSRGVKALREAHYLFLTWGTAYVYYRAGSKQVVANCHKMPERHFERHLASLSDLTSPWLNLIGTLLERNPRLQIILTVSPIRHLRDGAHGNQLSKSTLHLLCHELQTHYPDRLHYFPAYELVMDELRDYRFYAEDMTHPSEQTVRFIAERFATWLCERDNREAMQHLARLKAEYEHRPLHPDHPEAELRREQLMVRIKAFARAYPKADLTTWFAD